MNVLAIAGIAAFISFHPALPIPSQPERSRLLIRWVERYEQLPLEFRGIILLREYEELWRALRHRPEKHAMQIGLMFNFDPQEL